MGSKAKTAPEVNGLPIGLILQSLPAEFVQQAVQLAVAKMKLTPEKLALILVRHINPDEIIEQYDEAALRGKKYDTLKGYKDEGLFPPFLNGCARPQSKG